MPHLVNHAADFGAVLELDRVPNSPQTEAAHDISLIALEPDGALEQRHLDGAALRIRSLVSHCYSGSRAALGRGAGRQL